MVRFAKSQQGTSFVGILTNSCKNQIVTLETMVCLVHNYVTSRYTTHLLTRTETIVRNKKKFTLHNRSVLKSFKVVYDKRVLLSHYTTLPYDINNMSRSHVYVEEGFDLRFQFPFSAVISGPSSSGKTVLVKKLLCNADKMINVKIDNIVFLYSCWQPLYDELSSLFD